jgi:hypothetical protein
MGKFILVIVLIAAAFGLYRAYVASQEESKEVRTIRALPPSVQHVVGQMDPQAQATFFNEYERKRKKTSVGYLLWLIGFHYLYYGKVGLWFAYWITLAGLGFWALVDLFRMPSIAHAANEQMARQALQTLGIAAFAAPQRPHTPDVGTQQFPSPPPPTTLPQPREQHSPPTPTNLPQPPLAGGGIAG